MDCERPVSGRAWRCAPHKEKASRESLRRYALRNHKEVNARGKARARWVKKHDPARYAKRMADKKAWRARNVVKIKRIKGQWKWGGYSSEEKYRAYHATYRARHAERRRQLAREQYYRLHPDRPVPACRCCGVAIPWDGRGRPKQWLPGHQPYARCTTPQEDLVKAAAAAVRSLRAGLEKERDEIKGAIDKLMPLLSDLEKSALVAPPKRRMKAAA